MKRSLRKAYEITNAKISFVSLVDKAANKRTFLLKKAEDGKATFTTYGRIVKAEAENHFVTGIVYEPMVEDTHGNYMSEDEVRKAAYWYMKNGDKVDLQHSFEPLDGAAVVESWIAKADFDIDGEKIRKGTWLMTVEVADEDVWQGIEKGEITGFSMGGMGDYSEEDVELSTVNKNAGTNAGNIEKAGKSMSSKNLETLHGIKESLDAFIKSFEPEPEMDPDDEEQKKAGVGAAANGAAQNPANAAGTQGDGEKKKTVKKEDTSMTKHEIEAAIASAVEKAMASHNQNGSQQAADSSVTADGIQSMVEKAISKALEPIQKQEQEPQQITAEGIAEMIQKAVDTAVAPILKAKGLPTNLNGAEPVEKGAGEQHYLHGIL